MPDFELQSTWEEVDYSAQHPNHFAVLSERQDPDLGNIVVSSLTGAQIFDLLQTNAQKNIVMIDLAGRRCSMVVAPQTGSGTTVFSVVVGTTEYLYTMESGTGLVVTQTVDLSSQSSTDAKVNTIAVAKSGNIYSYAGADFDFTSLDEIMASASNGIQYRMAVINSQDVYPLSHMQGSQSTARLYFSGITWGTGMTSPLVEVFELDQILTVTKVSSVEVPSIPRPTAADNDKFLGVENGVYTLRDDIVVADEEQIIVPGYTNQVDAAGYTAGALLHSDGSVEYSGSGVVTGFIAVTKGDVIRIKSSDQTTLASMNVALYKANKATATGIGKTFASIISGTNYGSASVSGDTLTWDTASVNYYSWNDFAWMRITLPSSADIVTVNEEIVNVQTTRKTIPSDTKVLPASIVNPHKTLTGKKVVVFGDSIIGKCRDSTSVTAFAEEICGAECINVGFGGCRMSTHPTTGYAAFSMYMLADAIATNTWTAQDAEASSGESYFPAQLAKLKAIDFSTVDAIVIHYGTNDYNADVSMDNQFNSKAVTTVFGALRYSIERILSVYKHITIFVSVPIYRAWDNGAEGAETHVNKMLGKHLYDYCAGMKSVAQTYNLPVIDGYKSMGMNISNIAALTEDYTHLNEAGRSVFGKVMAGGLIAQNGYDSSVRIEKMMVTGSPATLFEQVYETLKTAAKSAGTAATQFSNAMATYTYNGAVASFADNALPRLVVVGSSYTFDWECSDYSVVSGSSVASFHGSDVDSDGLYDIVASFTSTGVVMMKVTYTACPAIS